MVLRLIFTGLKLAEWTTIITEIFYFKIFFMLLLLIIIVNVLNVRFVDKTLSPRVNSPYFVVIFIEMSYLVPFRKVDGELAVDK